jgi:predicted PurR-regulated permease PerM
MPSTSDQPGALQPDPTATSVWIRRLLYLSILLITVLLIGIFFWLANLIIVTLLILLVAALLAYAVAPVVELFHRIMPRALAIALVYVGAIILLGAFAYLAVKSLLPQMNSLTQSVVTLLKPGSNGKESPLDQTLKSIGITQSQINAATKQLQSQLGTIAGHVTSGTEQVVGGLISAGFNILITVVVSVYLLVGSYRFGNRQRGSSPVSQRGWISSALAIVQRVVGGYIRGQIVMSTCIAALQGVGLLILGVPYAVLIGALAFILEFIPTFGTILTGFIAVVIASTQSWTLALITLAYTIAVDFIEGYVLSPRVMSKAVEIQPVVSLLGMIAGSEVFGIWGAILAAPTMGLIQALVGAYLSHHRQSSAKT